MFGVSVTPCIISVHHIQYILLAFTSLYQKHVSKFTILYIKSTEELSQKLMNPLYIFWISIYNCVSEDLMPMTL
jgi:hypothetical protein